MAEIEARREAEDERGYRLRVTVAEEGGTSAHEVTLARGDLERLGRPGESPEGFVRRCFAFLLEREPKESILDRFDVAVIGRYFPEFEATISAGQPGGS